MGIEIAIYETDVQNDFTYRTGALFVHGFEKPRGAPYGAEARVPNILAIHRYAKERGYLILGSVDRHFYEDAELIRNKGGSFDDHCMNGTSGQLRIDGLERQADIYIQSKEGPGLGQRILSPKEIRERVAVAMKNGYHLIFEKQSYDVSTNPNFNPIMKELIRNGLRVVAIDGFATDYCVKAAALSIANVVEELGMKVGKDFEIYVVVDAIKEVNIDFEGNKDLEFGQKALEEMFSRGVKPITTEEILEGALEK